MKIFISGSRSINKLPQQVKSKLDNMIKSKHEILVGDAIGVDKLVRDYFQEKQYPNVSVYYTGQPRTQIPPQWNQIKIKPQNNISGRDYFTLKDIQMTEDCDIAFAIHDGKSKGTQANIDRATSIGKTTVVFNTETEKFMSNNVQPKTKLLKYKHPFAEEPEQLKVTVAQYMAYGKGIDSIGKMAIETTTTDGEPYSRLTTNITGPLFGAGQNIILPKNTAIIDTNNNPGIEELLQKTKLAKPYLMPNGQPIKVASGYCTYPIYKFDENELCQYDPRGYAEYSIDYDKKIKQLQQQGYKTLDDIFDKASQESKQTTRPLPDCPEENPDYEEWDDYDDDWRPGDAPWKAPGMSPSDFVL